MSRAAVRFSLALLLPLLLVAAPARAAGSDPAQSQREQVDRLFAAFDGMDRPGAAVGIIKDGEVVHLRGYGMANLEDRIPITPASRFQIASVSKQFACFAIHLLEQDGKLSLDDDIRRHLPEMHAFGLTITIRHMMNHTSGLREPSVLRTVAGWRGGDLSTHADSLDIAFKLRELNFEPGSEYVYNNLGYALLAEIVARASGQSFREFCEERIFQPLGMTSTHFGDDHREIIPNRAQPYTRAGGRFVHQWLNSSTLGSTGLFTTVEDLVKWDRNFYDATVGGPELIAAMQVRGRLNDGSRIGYASGLMIQTYRGQRVVAHTGSHAGYRISLFRVPEQRFTVIVLSNTTQYDRNEMPRRVADIYLADVLGPPEPEASEPPAEEAQQRPNLTHAQLEAYVGTFYSDEADGFVHVELRGERLVVRYRKGQSTLQPTGEDTFSGLSGNLRFARDGEGNVSGFFVSNARLRDLRFMRAEIRILGNQRAFGNDGG